MGGEGGFSPLPFPYPDLAYTAAAKQYRIQNTEYRMQKRVYIKLPIYCFFIWHMGFMILMWENPLLGPLEGVGPENLDFFGNEGRECHFGPKKKWIFPYQNHYILRLINNRYINS